MTPTSENNGSESSRKSGKPEVSDEDKVKLDIYWKMYSEHATQARHHEILRGTISTILVSVCAGLFSLFGFGKANVDPRYYAYIGWMLIGIGALGGLLSYKHYERNRLHVNVVRQFRKEIDKILSPINGSTSAPNKRGREETEREYPCTSKWLRVHYLWIAIFLAIIAVGALIANGATGNSPARAPCII